MTTKDDGGPFHPPTLDREGYLCFGASFRDVAAMYNHAALLTRANLMTICRRCGHEEIVDAATVAVREADALIAALKARGQ